jgi:putative hydrolase
MADGPDSDDLPDDDGGGSNEPLNPFASFPMFGDLARALEGQGPLNWDAARQFALLGATQGQPEHNIDPSARIAYTELARIASMHVNDVTGIDSTFPEPRIVTRSQWASETLDAYRPLFTDLATSLHQDVDADSGSDPMMQMMAGINRMMAPAMMGMSVGSMIGQLSQRVFGLHDLPIPREKQEIVLVGSTIDDFAAEWEIPLDEMRLWVLAHELSGHRLFAVPPLRDALAALVRAHVGGFRPDPSALADKLGGLDATMEGAGDPMEVLQQAFSDPEILLGAIRSEEQIALQPRLDAAVATVVGYTDWVVDAVAARVVGGAARRQAAAVPRPRAGSTPDDVFVERLLGIRVGEDQVLRGKAFVQGVVDRVGETELTGLLHLPDSMPTPNEIEAPGLWIARVTGE